MNTITTDTPLDERIVASAIASLEIFSIHLGRRLGLYEALQSPKSARDLAATTGIDIRYAREWLEQQATAGLISTEAAAASWDQRKYSLDTQQRAALLGAEDPSHVSPLADMVFGVSQALDAVAGAFHSGGGVPYADYGPIFRSGQAGINRPAFTHDLIDSWIDAAPDVVSRLETAGRVADLGCGEGWSTIALARRFPNAEVIGIDSDAASIHAAREHAAKEGVNPTFLHADADALDGPFDFIIMLEALHDMAKPVEVLAAARSALAPGGALLVADEKVADAFTAPGDEMERMMYGWSVVHCLPAAMAETPSAAIGTVLRPPLMRELASQAGFESVEQSDIDGGFFWLYVMR